jgi:hypothetical protein
MKRRDGMRNRAGRQTFENFHTFEVFLEAGPAGKKASASNDSSDILNPRDITFSSSGTYPMMRKYMENREYNPASLSF